MNPGTVVLRFLVRSGHLAPSARAGKLKQLRTGCKSTSSMMIDGHDAEFPLLSIIRTVHFTATPRFASQNLNVMHFGTH